LFTPTEKSETDDEINAEETRRKYKAAHDLCLQAFNLGQIHLKHVGIALIDSKMEASADTLGDEILTPDSSRFCDLSEVQTGVEPPYLDKEIARQEAVRMWGGKKTGPPLTFSDEIVQKLSRTYLDIFERVTGSALVDFQRDRLN